MTNLEIWETTLQDRKIKLEELQKEQEELANKISLASFEEDMYYKLVERYSKYHDAFGQRRIASEEVCNQLEEQKNRLSEEIKLINIEIDYIEEKIRLGTA